MPRSGTNGGDSIPTTRCNRKPYPQVPSVLVLLSTQGTPTTELFATIHFLQIKNSYTVGDYRGALAPVLFHAELGDSYKWMLYGDDGEWSCTCTRHPAGTPQQVAVQFRFCLLVFR
jgi:hypothetical protein